MLFRRAVPSGSGVAARHSCSDFAFTKSEQEDNKTKITIKRYSRKLTYEDSATQGVLPYRATPEEQVCQWDTLEEILTLLALCTKTQRKRFLLFAIYDYSYAEI